MIHALIEGRLKEPAKWRIVPRRFTDETIATMIASDAANRARVIELVTNDSDTGRALRKLKEGEPFSVTGEVSIGKDGAIRVRVRTVQTLASEAPAS
jgi:hypothetical protein